MILVWVEYVLFSIFVIFFLGFLSGLFSMDEKTSGTKDVYECGIEAFQESKTPFYLHFFLIGVLFLLFDVELIVCIPMVWMNIYEKVWGMVWFLFFFILFTGLVLELVMGSLSWKE